MGYLIRLNELNSILNVQINTDLSPKKQCQFLPQTLFLRDQSNRFLYIY